MIGVGDVGSQDEISLGELLRLHKEEHHSLEISDALGDGALLRRLWPLPNLRLAVANFGYQFLPVSQLNGIHCMFPILELDDILRTKSIPFRRTAVAAEYVLNSQPDFRISAKLFSEICIASYTYHEAAHAVFYEVSRSIVGALEGINHVEMMLVAEAFAISFEQLIALLAINDARCSTALFLSVSSYATPFKLQWLDEKTSGTSKRLAAIAADRPREVLAMLVCTHMMALLRPSAVAGKPELAEYFADYAQLRDIDRPDSLHLMAIGLRVGFDFRTETLRQYFSTVGLLGELNTLRSEPLSNFLASDRLLPRVLDSVVQVVLCK